MTPRIRAALRTLVAGLAAGIFLLTSASRGASAQEPAASDSPKGVWTGTAELNGQPVPFQLAVSGAGDAVRGELINGAQKSPSSSGSYVGGHLVLQFDEYANTLDATLHDGVLIGAFGRNGHTIPLSGRLNGTLPAASAHPPQIAGTWEIAVEGPKGEHAWKLRVRQTGAGVEAVIERIDGDTGTLYGTWRDGQFAISHFTAAGPSYAVLKPQADGTLQLVTFAHGAATQPLTARRPQIARAAGLAGPDDPLHHTALKNPGEPLTFRFPDLQGKLVSSTDTELRHKALIVSIGGSWCPNCQDEAPFLEELYRKYHSRGLEIVELSFEEESQRANPARLKAVIQKFGITYPVLVAGTPDQLAQTFPGVENLNCWPTTFFIGRDGLVKAIHTGYAGPATGKDNAELESETISLVQKLLAGGVGVEQVARAR